jgi:hypothetical protein
MPATAIEKEGDGAESENDHAEGDTDADANLGCIPVDIWRTCGYDGVR